MKSYKHLGIIKPCIATTWKKKKTKPYLCEHGFEEGRKFPEFFRTDSADS